MRQETNLQNSTIEQERLECPNLSARPSETHPAKLNSVDDNYTVRQRMTTHEEIPTEARAPETKRPVKHSPVLWLLSVAVPIGLIAAGMRALKGIDGWSALSGMLGIATVAFVIGALLAIGSLLRKERWPGGAYLSLLVNAAFLVWLHR